MAAFHNKEFMVSPFMNINTPDARKGHPNMMDIKIKMITSVTNTSNSVVGANPMSITIKYKSNHKIAVVIEVKKDINDNLEWVDTKTVIECIIYVQYAMFIEDVNRLVGIITDGTSWHCLLFVRESNSITLNVQKYVTFHAKEEELVKILPQVLKDM